MNFEKPGKNEKEVISEELNRAWSSIMNVIKSNEGYFSANPDIKDKAETIIGLAQELETTVSLRNQKEQ